MRRDANATPGASPVPDAQGGAGPWLPQTSVAGATWALFVGLGLVMVGNGLNGSLLGVRSQAEGFGLEVTGVIMAGYFAGFLLGSAYTEWALKNVGHIRVFAALASAASSVVLLQAISVAPVTWTFTRFVFGACMAGIYVVAESWLNDLATNETRGRILSIYMIVSMGGLGVGQLLLNVEDDSGFALFILVSILVSMSLLPVTLSATSAPPLSVPHPLGLGQLWGKAPSGVFTSFWTGAAAGALMGMAPVYASAVGMGSARISAFLFAPMVGALVFQWPVGWLSDRFPRRAVIVAVAGQGAAASLLLLAVGERSNLAVVAMFGIGGALFPLYSLAVAYTHDWLRPEEVLGASASLVRVNGTGAILGPLATAMVMATVSPRLLWWVLAGLFSVIGCYLLYRIVTRDALPVEQQRHEVAFPARASAMAANLLVGQEEPDS